jgi:hypothetical protein
VKHQTVAHRSAASTVPTQLVGEVVDSVDRVNVELRRGSASVVRSDVLRNLARRGWPEEVRLDPLSAITITSMKGGVGLVLQTGNMGRIYADLLKLQTLYINKKINSAVFLSWSKHAARALGENLAHVDRLNTELDIFRATITIPLLVIGIG